MKNIAQMTKEFGRIIAKNSPTILTGMSIAGIVTTTVLGIKATPKAIELIKEAEVDEQTGEIVPLTKMQVVKTTWKCYIPTVVMGGVTIGCMIGAHSINLKRNAALASLYSITDATLKEYQHKVVETIGENKARKIKDEIAQDKLNNNPVSKNEVIITGKGDTLCYDSLSGRYFRSNIDDIKKIQNELNRQLLSNMWISLNEVYCELGLAPISIGHELGWNVDSMIEFSFSAKIADDDQPCIVIDYLIGPKEDYTKTW